MSDQLSSDLASLRISRDVPPERGRTAGYVVAAIAVLAVAGGVYAVGMPYLEARLFRPEVRAAEIIVVSPAESSVELTASGYVVAERTSKVGPKVEGRIARLLVKENDLVKAGQLIAELDAVDQESALASARARVAASKARAQLARANLAESRLQFERQQALAERGAAPKATAQDLEARVRSLDEAAKAADAEVEATEAEVKSVAVLLQHTRIVAPIDGRVVEKSAEVGELVGAASVIVELADFSTLIVEIDVPEGRLGRVKPKGPGEIVLDAYPGRRYRAETVEVVPRVNRSKATVPVKVRFVDEPEGVLPNMSARVSFLQKALELEAMKEPPKTIVPGTAIADRGGAKVVFVLDGDMVRMAPVSIGAPFGGGFELISGPPPGTKVVASPPPTMTDGQRIKERTDG